MGHVPYSRKPVLPVDVGGHMPVGVDGRRRQHPGKGAGFEAAADAAKGRLWPCEPVGEVVPGNRRGQRQWIERSACLLGMSGALTPSQAEAITEELELAGLKHREARQQFLRATTLRERGQAIVSVLALGRLDDEMFARLLAAGMCGGCWGQAWLFHPRIKRRLSPMSRIGRAIRRPP